MATTNRPATPSPAPDPAASATAAQHPANREHGVLPGLTGADTHPPVDLEDVRTAYSKLHDGHPHS